MAQAVAIVNPRAAGGRTLRLWPLYERTLREKIEGLEVLRTEHPGHASELTRNALKGGADLVIAVGGDGTANEVVNGFFSGADPVRARARFGLIPIGTGGDLQRTLRLPIDPDEAAAALASGETRPIDVARIRLTSHEGKPASRIFLNIASFGMGGEVSVRAKSNVFTRSHGKLAFLWATARTALAYRGRTIRLSFDQGPFGHSVSVTNVAVGNGRYHGGGMLPCPLAEFDDGLLDVTTIRYLPLPELIWNIHMLYSGKVYEHPKTTRRQVRRIRAESDQEVLIEVDGEALGMLPLEVELLPRALQLAFAAAG